MRVVVIVAVVVLAVVAAVAIYRMARGPLPGNRRPALQPLTDGERALAAQLRRDVEALASRGPRTVYIPENLRAAAAFIDASLRGSGYAVQRQTFPGDGMTCENLEVELRGSKRPDEIVIIGAHYDSVDTSPGADDNASGVAALLAIARALREWKPARTVRLVAFANEEPPRFTTPQMGSYVYAKRSRTRGENIVAMISLEAIGYYDSREGSQQYPAMLARLYPSTADFIAFAGNLASRRLVDQCAAAFRKHARFPSEAAALPQVIPEVGWSDQWSFWQFGWPALMVTDTAPFRNPHYHRATDLPETLDYERLARVVDGLKAVVTDLGGD